jgi:hypothetical protein
VAEDYREGRDEETYRRIEASSSHPILCSLVDVELELLLRLESDFNLVKSDLDNLDHVSSGEGVEDDGLVESVWSAASRL